MQHKNLYFDFLYNLSETFLILRRNELGMIISVRRSSMKSTRYSFQILMKLEFLRRDFLKSSNTKFHENSSAYGYSDKGKQR